MGYGASYPVLLNSELISVPVAACHSKESLLAALKYALSIQKSKLDHSEALEALEKSIPDNIVFPNDDTLECIFLLRY